MISNRSIEFCREEIDKIDDEIINLLIKRMHVSKVIAEEKKLSEDKTIYRADREQAILVDVAKKTKNEGCAPQIVEIFKKIMEMSRNYQINIFAEN